MQRSEAASPVLTTAPVLGSRSISEPWFALATHVSLLRGARRPRRKLPVGGLSVLFEGTDTADWSVGWSHVGKPPRPSGGTHANAGCVRLFWAAACAALSHRDDTQHTGACQMCRASFFALIPASIKHCCLRERSS